MKKTTVALVILAFLFTDAALLGAQTTELVYEGKTLNQWIEQLRRKDRDDINREKMMSYLGEAVNAIAKIGEPAVPPLLELLKNEDKEVRKAGAWALGAIGPPAKNAVPALIKMMEDRFVRLEAAASLGKIGPAAKDAVPALIKLLKERRREEAAKALGGIGPSAKDAVPALVEALKDNDSNVRTESAEALGNIGPAAKDAVPALREALAATVKPLVGTVSPRDVVNALKDENFRIAIREALWKIEGP